MIVSKIIHFCSFEISVHFSPCAHTNSLWISAVVFPFAVRKRINRLSSTERTLALAVPCSRLVCFVRGLWQCVQNLKCFISLVIYISLSNVDLVRRNILKETLWFESEYVIFICNELDPKNFLAMNDICYKVSDNFSHKLNYLPLRNF